MVKIGMLLPEERMVEPARKIIEENHLDVVYLEAVHTVDAVNKARIAVEAGAHILHFESYPQVLEGGFWSVTAYGDDDFLIDNPIDRYCINDRSGLQANDHGSVDVILSEDAPKDTTNWLPVGAGVTFSSAYHNSTLSRM